MLESWWKVAASGAITRGIRRDIRQLSDEARKSGLAAQAIALAESMDAGDIKPYERAQVSRELRAVMSELKAMGGGGQDDPGEQIGRAMDSGNAGT